MADPEGRPPWAGADGLPTRHGIAAALWAASLIDEDGSTASEARESYWHQATGGVFSSHSLTVGEQLLLDTGLLVRRSDRLYLTPALEELLDGSVEDAVGKITLEALSVGEAPPSGALDQLISDPELREEILLAREQRFDDSRRRLVGEIGEEIVVARARHELAELGRPDLEREVRRVSLTSDALGYDVRAPRILGRPRLLEVKTTTRIGEEVEIHISRNEASTGARFGEWSLVVCQVDDLDARSGRILGWCQETTISARLPTDPPQGRWEQAAIQLEAAELLPDLPPATL